MESDAPSEVGVGTAATWRAAGLSRAQLARLFGTGELVRIRYGVYATARLLARAQDDPRLAHAVQVAAVRAARTHKGVASHHSAAQLHGLDLLRKPADGTVTLTVPPGTCSGPFGRAGVVHHVAGLPAEHVVRLYDVPATTAARTVTDIARTASFTEGVMVADSALRERHTSKTELRRVLAHCERWPGASQAGQVIDFANGLAESVLESCARVSFRDQGLPPPELQVNIVGRADAIAELKRDRLLREAGFEVVHFTWKELFTEPARVATRIHDAFNRTIRLAR